MMKKWKILHSRHAFRHVWYTVRQDTVQLPDGRILDDYFVSVRPDVVLVLAMTAAGEIPLVRQYKHGVQQVLLEVPGGFVDQGEAPPDAARRELLEETGCRAGAMRLLGQVHDNPTKNTETLHLYLATNAVKAQEQALDQTEDIAVEWVTLDRLRPLITQGRIRVSGSITTIYLALEHLGQL